MSERQFPDTLARFFIIFSCLFSAPAVLADPSAITTNASTDELYDYFVPKVCVDAAGNRLRQNPLLTLPNGGPCDQTRSLWVNEPLPYYRTDFLPINASDFDPTHPSYNPDDPRIFIFPLSKTYDATDETVSPSTMIVQWQSLPLDKKGDADRFRVLHDMDSVSAITIRNGYGSLLGGYNHRALASSGKSTYALSSGEGMFDFKLNGGPERGVALFERAWFYPEVGTAGKFTMPAYGKPSFAAFPKRTLLLPVDSQDQPVLDLSLPLQATSLAVSFVTVVPRFRFGPADCYSSLSTDHSIPLNHILNSAVQYGFAKTNLTHDGPGVLGAGDVDANGNPIANNAGVSEHTYLSRELGYNTRWELWHGFNAALNGSAGDAGAAALQSIKAAINAYERANCTPPANIGDGAPVATISASDDDKALPIEVAGQRVRMITPHFAVSDVLVASQSDASGNDHNYYYQNYFSLDQNAVWHRHTWYMEGCHDSTNLKTDYVNNYNDPKKDLKAHVDNSFSSTTPVLVHAAGVPNLIDSKFFEFFRGN